MVRSAASAGMSTAPVILEYAEEIDADVIVMSTHGQTRAQSCRWWAA